MANTFGLLAFLQWNQEWNNWHFPDEMVKKAAAQIKELGVGMVRLDIVWNDIHQGPGRYDYERYDWLIAELKSHGINLLALLHYNKDRLDAEGRECWNTPPESFEEFAAYVKSTVARYKDSIHAWEIWNEPNHPVYWSAAKDGLREYIRLLKLSYRAAKEADPTCLVLNGGITEPVVEDVRNFYANGGKNATDVLAIHTFLDPLDPNHELKFDEIIGDVRATMIKNGDENKKIWITEMGCPGVPASLSVKDWWAGKNVSEAHQAEWLEKQYKMARKYPFIEKLFWAFYRDTNGIFKDGVDHFGLVRFDLSPKPSFERMKKLIHS